ncbi:branched-chain amino acid ABC transporter substrate-binding protein [Paraburkholderia caballeronis]|uniref:Amino acid/amide ABC transporter substrate-binding protein, HAAT family n=1 Tax=Paraburkholderia caballeronis TaxID=416943 RepID=A0A1H7LHI7_9BURK|nr:branched-chain amino acid ABC transporter substrate-binding protein [Paraburkholderia caballeronis]PXW28446.1 amino acid/amide ABC transporter substrate-binding protein (HAAT family) [Paraburkholderia caballeronis]PXX03812.1 amino acid/amide ABC transporter substrate-binding protein (HAAT family) [Paraburkholderia caballeronis]RAK04556.1 amino acid/amide ABC transporter substrate-binding protein (HAAT family) [Paraburkholderia caballeronis]TDV19465.1 amino acid/amide ABC transporter substrat
MSKSTALGRELATVGIFAALAAAHAGVARADDTVKIGEAAPVTGPASYLGKDTENGARLAIEEINQAGLTIGGKKITLVFDAQDDAGDPRQATQVAQKLVDDKVAAVVGHMQSGSTIPASKIYSDAGIVQVSPSATNPAYTQQGFKTAYRVVATDAQQGPTLADYAANTMKIHTVAIVDDSTAYGQGLAVEFEKQAKADGITVLSHDATNDKAVDFRAILTKIKGEKPDAIMYGGLDGTGGPFAKQAKQLGIAVKVLAGDGLCADDLAKLAGDAADDVVCSIAGAPLLKMPDGPAFVERYKKRFGYAPVLNSPFAYDAVGIIVDAMKRAQSTEPDKILAAMPATDHHGVLGETQFDAKGDLRHGVISLYKYVGGKQTLLSVVEK